ncbi:unnamed protein product [marine sediment metagenome]|uniref:Uncharacterized protein n=1 Tax=marine sediment metagenome TaxID=412755 RepID=X1UZJ1_9ZZZZ
MNSLQIVSYAVMFILSASILLNIYLVYWFNGAQQKIKTAMTILSKQGVEAVASQNTQEDINTAIERVAEGMALSDPSVQVITGLISQFAPDLELDPQTLQLLMTHPRVQAYLKNFTQNKPGQSQEKAGSYRFKGGLL